MHLLSILMEPSTLGFEWCIANGIKKLNVFGGSMLIVKQVQGIWACKSDKLAAKLRAIKGILKQFTTMQVHYIAREKNKAADALASDSLKDAIVGAIKLQEPKLQGKESLQDIIDFLETGVKHHPISPKEKEGGLQER